MNGDRSSFGESTSILDRIRTRIRNGEEWNVCEVWTPETHILVGSDANDPEAYEVTPAGWNVIDDEKVKTAGERLKELTPYDVMDSKSAEESSVLIEKQLEKIQEWREELPELIDKLQDKDSINTEAYMFLESIVFHNGNREVSLNAPDNVSLLQGR